MLEASISRNDKRAYWIIGFFSVVIFTAVVVLGRVKWQVDIGFDAHIFALFNAFINSAVSIILIAGLAAVKRGNYLQHKKFMIAALILSIIFLLFYIAHHLLSGETKFGGKGIIRLIYFVILISHIFLAAIILPLILFTTYRALTAQWVMHKKLAKFTWPLWLYVAVTGPVIYLMISPYY